MCCVYSQRFRFEYVSRCFEFERSHQNPFLFFARVHMFVFISQNVTFDLEFEAQLHRGVKYCGIDLKY